MREKEQNNLPYGWEQTSIGDAYRVIGGGTPSTKNDKFWGGSVPWITSADINGVREIDISKYVTQAGIENSTTNLVPERALLVVTRVGLGKIAIANQPICFSQDLQGLVQDPKLIFPEFSLYFLSFVLQRLKFEGRGTTISGLTKKQLMDTFFPLPPLNEQRRIVAKIEELFSELDKGVESLKTARAQLKTYRQAVLKHAFEGKLTAQWREENKDKLEPADKLLERIKSERETRYQQQLEDWQQAVKAWEDGGNEGKKKPGKPRKPSTIEPEGVELPVLPEEWTWEQIGNLNIDVFDGPFGSNLKTSDYVDEGVRVIRLENIGYLKFIENKLSYVTEEKYETIRRHTVHSGDIIFSSFIIDGIRVVILPPTIDCAINKADCFCVRVHGNTISNEFLTFFLSTRAAYKQIEADIHGIGRPRINTTQLKSFIVPICNPNEQLEIISQLSKKLSLVENIEGSIDSELQKSEALRQSILKKAFSGQLVPQDSNDEPASVLLERICAEKAAQATAKAKTKKKPKRKNAA